MFADDDPLRVEYLDGRKWKLVENFTYIHDKEPWGYVDVPAGFLTDFASIPRALWAALPPTGQYGKAAVIHDWLYFSGQIEGRDAQLHPITRGNADAIFREAMDDLGVPRMLRWTIWSAVRAGGSAIWERRRRFKDISRLLG